MVWFLSHITATQFKTNTLGLYPGFQNQKPTKSVSVVGRSETTIYWLCESQNGLSFNLAALQNGVWTHANWTSKTHQYALPLSESQIVVKHLAKLLDWAGNNTDLVRFQAENRHKLKIKLYIHFQMTARILEYVSIIQNSHSKINQLCANIQRIRTNSTPTAALDLSSWPLQLNGLERISTFCTLKGGKTVGGGRKCTNFAKRL